MIEFREITANNFKDIVNMKLPENKFVAPNVYSLAQAWLFPNFARPYAIYNDGTLIGFIMFDVDYEERELGIWRLMIAQEHQNQGFGYQVLQKVISEWDREKFDYIHLSCVPENAKALHLYKKVGFRETGEMDGDELVMVYDGK